jgi:hypothetical protein
LGRARWCSRRVPREERAARGWREEVRRFGRRVSLLHRSRRGVCWSSRARCRSVWDGLERFARCDERGGCGGLPVEGSVAGVAPHGCGTAVERCGAYGGVGSVARAVAPLGCGR